MPMVQVVLIITCNNLCLTIVDIHVITAGVKINIMFKVNVESCSSVAQ